MPRMSEASANRELAQTKQRPYAAPKPPRKSVPVLTFAKWAAVVLAAAVVYGCWRELAEVFGRLG